MIYLTFVLLATVTQARISAVPSVSQLNGRIIGGRETTIEKFPHQVSVQFNGEHLCGGSIIAPQWILTAAHCIYGRNRLAFSIRYGSTQHNNGIFIKAKQVIPHEYFNSNNFANDFALLELDSPVTLSDKAQVIKLTNKEPTPNTLLAVSGWGNTFPLFSQARSTPNLMTVNVPVVDRKTCAYWYENYNMKITIEMFCAGYKAGGRDACQGDSGGPIINKATGEQVGIVSWGIGCGRDETPGVYSNIANRESREWIKERSGV